MDSLPNATVNVQLPKELGAGPNNSIVFSIFKFPETNRVRHYTWLYKFIEKDADSYSPKASILILPNIYTVIFDYHGWLVLSLNSTLTLFPFPSLVRKACVMSTLL